MRIKALAAAAVLILHLAAARAVELESVGLSVSDLSNPFFVEIAQGVRDAAAEISDGRAEVRVVSNSYDLQTQIRQIRDFVTSGVQMIVLNAADPDALRTTLEDARRQGIVVVAVDVTTRGADVTITSDNFQAGTLACEYLAQRLGGKGSLVIVNGPPVSSTIKRVAGCKSALERYPAIRILSDDHNSGGSRTGGLTTMAALLIEHPQVDAVFAINDPTALGADLAARRAGRDRLIIASVDGAPEAVDALRDPNLRLVATAAQDPRVMAIRGVKIGYDLLNGNRPVLETTILIPTPLITRENVDGYKGWTTARDQALSER